MTFIDFFGCNTVSVSYLQDVELYRPQLIWLSLLVLPIVFLFLKKQGDRKSLFLRGLILLLLVLALADPGLREKRTVHELAALVDTSYSLGKEARKALLSSLEPYLARENQEAKIFPFAGETDKQVIEVSGSRSLSELEAVIESREDKLDTGQTNIAQALGHVASFSDASSVLLLSDGFENLGQAEKLARQISASGLSVFPLVPDETVFYEQKLSISSLYAPVTATSGKKVEIRTSVSSSLSAPKSAVLELWFADEKLYSRELRFPPGEETLVSVQSPVLEGGLHRIRAVLRAQGEEEEEQVTFLSVKNKEKLLLLSGSKEDERVIKNLLGQKGYAVQNIITDGRREIPQSFKGYPSIILNNVARRQLPRKYLEKLETFVENGGGLLIVGGDSSFGLGAYLKSPLERISPLRFVPPQTKKRRVNSAVVLVLDKSRSMAFQRKIDAAKRAALVAVNTLKQDDYVGVIGFDSSPFVIIRLSEVSKVKPIAERRLRNLTAAGKTNLLPALAKARQSLRNNDAGRKHIIILSDGKVPLAGSSYTDEMSRLRKEGVTVSTVALGTEADVPFMKTLSRYGKGAFYHTLDPSKLPEIFLHDIRVAVGERTMREKQKYSVRVGPSGLVSTSISNYPDLLGFVETRPKPGAELELTLQDGQKDFPLLASWDYKLGHVIAFTSDANGRWSRDWLRWSEFTNFWGEIFESLKTPDNKNSEDIDFDIRYRVNQKTLELDLAVFDQNLRRKLSPKISAKITEPGSEQKEVSFRPVKKGRFLAEVENARPGDYRLDINYGELKFPPVALSLSGDIFGEIRGKGINIGTLSKIARASGGRINPKPEEVQAQTRIKEVEKHFYPYLLALAFLLILFEAFVREMGLLEILKGRFKRVAKVSRASKKYRQAA